MTLDVVRYILFATQIIVVVGNILFELIKGKHSPIRHNWVWGFAVGTFISVLLTGFVE